MQKIQYYHWKAGFCSVGIQVEIYIRLICINQVNNQACKTPTSYWGYWNIIVLDKISDGAFWRLPPFSTYWICYFDNIFVYQVLFIVKTLKFLV